MAAPKPFGGDPCPDCGTALYAYNETNGDYIVWCRAVGCDYEVRHLAQGGTQ